MIFKGCDSLEARSFQGVIPSECTVLAARTFHADLRSGFRDHSQSQLGRLACPSDQAPSMLLSPTPRRVGPAREEQGKSRPVNKGLWPRGSETGTDATPSGISPRKPLSKPGHQTPLDTCYCKAYAAMASGDSTLVMQWIDLITHDA